MRNRPGSYDEVSRRPARNKTGIVEEWLLLLGGTLAVSVSITLAISLVIRPDASINPLNAVTFCLGFLGGTTALVFPGSIRAQVAATVLLLIAAAPTVFGWVWLLYVPPILLLAVGAALKIFLRCIGTHLVARLD